MRPTAAIWLVAPVAVVLAGCPADRLSLVVDVKSDLVPNEEFVLVRTELFADDPGPTATPIAIDEIDAAALSSDRLPRGARVAELSDLSPSEPVLRVRMMARDGSVTLERLARIHLDASRAVTLLMTRSCLGVTCDEGAACVAGVCVDSTCTVEDPSGCPMAECAADDDCPAPAVPCGLRRCESGACLALGDDARCGAEQFCHPTLGCRDRAISTPDAGTDAGPPPPDDAGAVDAGAPDAGAPDAGAPDAGCAPRSCAAAGAECGAPDDGCGEVLDCGPCTPPEVCGGGMDPYGCATPPPTDTTRPTAMIVSGPDDPTSSRAATLTFTGSDTGGSGLDHFECRLDGAAWATCTSPRGLSALSDGSHTFEVRAHDGAANVSLVDGWTWRVDTLAPTVSIPAIMDPRPSSYAATAMVSFSYTCTDPGGSGCVSSTRSCTVDGSTANVTCGASSGTVQAGFTGAHAFGDHMLVVTVEDAAGNVGMASRAFTVTRCADDLQYPNRTSDGVTRGDCCSGLVSTAGWTDFSFGFYHPRGDGSCRPMSDWDALPWECIWGGASCPSGYQTTAAWGAGCTSAFGRTTCVPSLADANTHCGSDGGSGSQTPFHGRANEGWHPAPAAGCSVGRMSTSELLMRTCSTNVCWNTIDVANARGSMSASEGCNTGLTRHCRSNPVASEVACVCLATGSDAPYASDGRN